jgi:hypothetical protein
MPTAPKASKAKTKAKARKAPARKPAKAATRRSSATKAKATRAKASRTRAVNESQAAVRDSQKAAREGAGVVGDYAERAVLIPVGAALIARERVVSSVSDTISSYSSPTKAQAQLRKFERRGATARKRLEREVRKTRVRFERDLRQRRKNVERTVNGAVRDIEKRRDVITKNGSEITDRGSDFANQVQERILSLV